VVLAATAPVPAQPVPALSGPSKLGMLREVLMEQMATLEFAIGELHLITDVAPIGPDASDTDRLMAQAGRARLTISPSSSHEAT
jgi:hypothetical protein